MDNDGIVDLFTECSYDPGVVIKTEPIPTNENKNDDNNENDGLLNGVAAKEDCKCSSCMEKQLAALVSNRKRKLCSGVDEITNVWDSTEPLIPPDCVKKETPITTDTSNSNLPTENNTSGKIGSESSVVLDDETRDLTVEPSHSVETESQENLPTEKYTSAQFGDQEQFSPILDDDDDDTRGEPDFEFDLSGIDDDDSDHTVDPSHPLQPESQEEILTAKNVSAQVLGVNDSDITVEPFHPVERESTGNIETEDAASSDGALEILSKEQTDCPSATKPSRESTKKNARTPEDVEDVPVVNKELKIVVRDFMVYHKTNAKVVLKDLAIPLLNNVSMRICSCQRTLNAYQGRNYKNLPMYEDSSSGDDSTVPRPRWIKKRQDCPYCDNSYAGKESLLYHLWRKHSDVPNLVEIFSIKILNCELCDFKTAARNKFKDHLRIMHRKNGPATYKCTECDFETLHNSSLYTHNQTMHKKNRIPFMCLYCNKAYVYKYLLADHLIAKHDEKFDKSLKQVVSHTIRYCTLCSFRCVLKNKFDLHMAGKHGAKYYRPTFECYNCNFKCFLKTHLIRHIANHYKSNNVECKFCEERFANENALDRHLLKRHTNKKREIKRKLKDKWVSCSHCSFKSISKLYMNKHIRIQHEEVSENKEYTCEKCGFKANLKRVLLTHKSTHYKKKLTCALCDLKFNSRLTLGGHLVRDHRTHEGGELVKKLNFTVYDCKICIYRSVSRPGYDKHLRVHAKYAD